MFATGFADDGVSVFSLAANGTLTNVIVPGGNVTDAGALELDGAVAVTTAVLNGTTYLFVAGRADDGISVFSVNNVTGALTNVENEMDAGDTLCSTASLRSPWPRLAAATVLIAARFHRRRRHQLYRRSHDRRATPSSAYG